MEDSYSELKSSLSASAVPVKALNYSSRLILARNLDCKQVLTSEEDYARDYRGLGELIGFQYQEIKKFEEFEDRTMKILESWETRPDAKLDKLITYLEKMDRYDVILELKPSLKKNVDDYLNYQKSLEIPIQDPEVSSVQPCSSSPVNLNLKNRFITTSDVQSGECTIFDAYVSYADEDIHIAMEFARVLESPQVGLRLFLRERDMLAGCPELNTDIELIKNRCRRMMIILTPNFIKSPALEFQVSFAGTLAIEQKQRILIPVILTMCEIPPILNSVSKIDFTKPYTHDWMMDKLITSLRPTEDRIFLDSNARSQRSIRDETTSDSANSISTENRPVITFPASEKYSLSSGVQINSNALLSIAPPANISDEERISGACSEILPSTACDEIHQSTACSEMHQSASSGMQQSTACSGMHQSAGSGMHQSAACPEPKEVLSPPKSSSKRFHQFMSLFNRKGNSTSTSSASFSSGATSGFHSQSSSNIKSLENSNEYTEDMQL